MKSYTGTVFVYGASLTQRKDCKKIMPVVIYKKGHHSYNQLETSRFIRPELFQNLSYDTSMNYVLI